MPAIRRIRGYVLRLARRRVLSVLVGAALVLPAAWLELADSSAAWWLEGLSVVAGCTGVALVWTGLTGIRSDWIGE